MDHRSPRPRTIYIAARFSRQDEMRDVAALVKRVGHAVVSRWVESADRRTHEELWPEHRADVAHRDMLDMAAADTLLYFGPPGRNGGSLVELGIAIAKPLMDVVVIGEPDTVFGYLSLVKRYDTIHAFLRSDPRSRWLDQVA